MKGILPQVTEGGRAVLVPPLGYKKYPPWYGGIFFAFVLLNAAGFEIVALVACVTH